MTPTGGLRNFRARPSGILWASLYSNWDSKELPDNVTAPACMMMYNYGHWRDFSCESGQFAFICERRQNCWPNPLYFTPWDETEPLLYSLRPHPYLLLVLSSWEATIKDHSPNSRVLFLTLGLPTLYFLSWFLLSERNAPETVLGPFLQEDYNL